MQIEDRSEFGRDILAGIADEVLLDEPDNELPSIKKLRIASEDEARYEIIDELDQGGMKIVYRAFDKKTCRDVALAYVRIEKLSEKSIRYFIQESWITAKLEHPNIVPIYDIGLSPNGTPYFAMKLLSGETLRSILSKLDQNVMAYSAKYSERDLLTVFLKVCDAVSYAHERGVVHLDLKPDNIQISDFGQVLVLDWGIANVLQMSFEDSSEDTTRFEDSVYTRFGAIKGTPGFIAPELITNSEAKPDYKADIYGLGAILYSILVYERPEPVITVTDTREEDLFHLKTLENMETIPSALQSVIKKAMSLSPEDRYDSVEMLKSEVEAFLAGHATLAEEAGFWRQQSLLIKRNARLFASIACSFVVIIALTVSFIAQLTESERNAIGNAERAIKSEKRALMNEKRALAQEKIANERELVAKQLLEKYKAEKELRKEREKTSARHYTARAQAEFARCDTEKALSAIDEYLRLYSGEAWVQYLKMQVLLAINDFDTILSEMGDYEYAAHYQLAKKYSKIKAESNGKWLDHFEAFFEDILKVKSGRKFNFLCNVLYNVNKGKRFTEQEQFLEKLLERFYPGSQLVYDVSNDRITLTSKKYFAASLIAGLNVRELDLSGVNIVFTDFLWRHPELEYLNLKGSSIVDLTALTNMPKLRYLNLENTTIPYLMAPQKSIYIEYLNIANTSLRDYDWEMIEVETINIIGADNFDLKAYIKGFSPPERVLLSESQMSLLSDVDTKEIRFFVYKNSDDVDEDDFF